MGEAARQFPDDNDIAVLYAEAVMDLSPWDYWKPGGAEPNPQSAPVVPTLERVLARNPSHPGALHYYIHAVEASDRPGRAEGAWRSSASSRETRRTKPASHSWGLPADFSRRRSSLPASAVRHAT